MTIIDAAMVRAANSRDSWPMLIPLWAANARNEAGSPSWRWPGCFGPAQPAQASSFSGRSVETWPAQSRLRGYHFGLVTPLFHHVVAAGFVTFISSAALP